MRHQQQQLRGTRQQGFTLVEVTIIVTTLAILSAIMLPQMGVYLREARFARVREDVGAIGVAIMQLLKDTGESALYKEPQGNWRSPQRIGSNDGGEPIGLLVGDGDTPDGNDYSWRASLDDHVPAASTDFGNVWIPSGLVDTFANHLIHNNPGGGDNWNGVGSPWARYRTPAEMTSGDHSSGQPNGLQFDPSAGEGFNSDFAWRGPYLDAVRPDPWGNRYSANVLWFTIPQGGNSSGFNRPIVVISAGPDEEIDTDFSSSGGFVVGDDDIAYPVAFGSLR